MIGIDVGGANLKIVTENALRIRYCPLWEGAELREHLLPYANGKAAVVMTGELADCFRSRREGIDWIVSSVREAIPDAIFYGTDGRFHREPVAQLAAANWLASASFLMGEHGGRILVDMGSTTTDIVPLVSLRDLLGLTDLERLRRGYLVYTGMLRTPVAAITHSLHPAGIETPVSAECFAIAADVHLLLGHIESDGYTCPAPDGREKTRESSASRLARQLCAEPEELGGATGIVEMAMEIWEAQRRTIAAAIERVRKETGAGELVTAGIGSSLLARELGGEDLSGKLGEFAAALPAYAVREMALRTAGC